MRASNNNRPDIIFVVSPANSQSDYMPFYYLYLAGYLEKSGFLVEILNPHEERLQNNCANILRELRERNPKYVGLACFVTDFDIVHDLASQIKIELGLKIIVGNAHASIAPEDFLYEGSPFDIVVRGEGEKTVEEILASAGELNILNHINGIAYWQDGTLVMTSKRELMNLADCGVPAYHLIDMQWYKQPTKYIIRRLATIAAVIYTGRGCPFNCSFCASNTVWQANKVTKTHPLVRKRPLSSVMEELKILQDTYNFDFFYILDDTFGVTENDIIDFCRAYSESGLKMLWAAETRVNCIKNEDIVKILKKAGCIQLDFGVESGSPKMLKSISKNCTVQQVREAFALCKKYGIRTFANILLNLPEEDEVDLRLTQELLTNIKPDYVSVGITQPYPGTTINKKLVKKIPKEDYHKLSRLLPAEEFRLSIHKLYLEKLVFLWLLKYGTVAPFEKSLFKAGLAYWIRLYKSTSRTKYIYFILKEILTGPFYYTAYIMKRVRLIFKPLTVRCRSSF